ncbi:MAG: hypothetical protein DWH89_04355 [Planctomycetota bacterium]|nr:MAG: hypothetical protein DWH89_04355 [Planctomycetota bacterium]
MLRRKAQFLVIAGVAAPVALLTGCASVAPCAESTRMSKPTRWTLVAPKGVRELPEVKALIAARATRFTVEVIEFDPGEGTAESRLASVRARLAKAPVGATASAGATTESATGTTASATTDQVLVIGSPEVISMGPWNFAGVKQPIATDWLLTTNLEVGKAVEPVTAWQAALSEPALRTVGRLPFDDTKMVSLAAQATLEHDRNSQATTGTAVLGASGTAYAWPIASARRQLQDAGWNASLYGEGGSCDSSPRNFMPAWQGTDGKSAASLVVVAGPSYAAINDGGPARGVQWLIRPAAASGAPGARAGTQLGKDASSPNASPASLLVAFTPGFARPGTPDIADLMAWQQAAAIASFTADISASPVTPALESMVNIPRQLAHGTPVGIVIESERRAYWARASSDLVSWMPTAKEDRAQIALSAVLYGDPALQACKTPAGTLTRNDALPLPVVVTDSAFGETITDTPAPASGMSGRAMALTIALFAIVVALAAAWTSRRKDS